MKFFKGVDHHQEFISVYGGQVSKTWERERVEETEWTYPGCDSWRAWASAEFLYSLGLPWLIYRTWYSTEYTKVRDHDVFIRSLKQSQIISTYTYKYEIQTLKILPSKIVFYLLAIFHDAFVFWYFGYNLNHSKVLSGKILLAWMLFHLHVGKLHAKQKWIELWKVLG